MTAYSVGTYSRLSREDLKNGRKDASVSIENQMAMLQQYAEEKGWNIHKAYLDDDVTGTTFDRPGFQEMLGDINSGKINCVITKDLSRFGRNYTESALHREQFDRQGVRYIAIHDNHDSLHYKETREFNITTPIKDLVNEMYASDVSRKVRYTKKLLASQGKFCNSRAPYGYQKSKENKHVLIIDEDVAHNVVRIFKLYISGMTARSIADEFNREKITTPNAYHYKTINKPDPYTGNKNVWGSASIMNIIKNPVYYGVMVNGKREVVSYKDKRRVLKSESEWIVIENTHEPIVSKDTWDEAQRIRAKRKRTNIKRSANGEVAVFAGLIKCADCGGSMIFNRKPYKNYTKEFFRCSTYTQKGKSVCSMHSVDYDTIYQAILADIQKHAELAVEDEQKLINQIITDNEAFKSKNLARYERNVRESNNRIQEIDTLVQSLFEDKTSGAISDELFKRLTAKYEKEQRQLIRDLEKLESEVDDCKRVAKNLTDWTKRIRACLSMDTITRAIAFELIDRIEVSEEYDENSEKCIDISIFYKFGLSKAS